MIQNKIQNCILEYVGEIPTQGCIDDITLELSKILYTSDEYNDIYHSTEFNPVIIGTNLIVEFDYKSNTLHVKVEINKKIIIFNLASKGILINSFNKHSIWNKITLNCKNIKKKFLYN